MCVGLHCRLMGTNGSVSKAGEDLDCQDRAFPLALPRQGEGAWPDTTQTFWISHDHFNNHSSSSVPSYLASWHGQLYYCFEAGSYRPATCCVEDDFELLIPCLHLSCAPIKGVSSLVTHWTTTPAREWLLKSQSQYTCSLTLKSKLKHHSISFHLDV